MQLVHLVERGERAQMSKRRGEFVTLDELIDDIGVDAARFFMLQRCHDTTLDLDLDLAREPVAGEPRLLRPVRARADREHPAQGRARSEWRRLEAATSARGEGALEPPSGRSSSGCWSCRTRCARRPSAAHPTG